MSEKIAKTICRYGNDHGYYYLRLENQENKLICVFGSETESKYLSLPQKEASSVVETFRYLVGIVDNEFFTSKRFKIIDKNEIIKGYATLLPSNNGEKLIITLKKSNPETKRLNALGLNTSQQKIIKSALNKKNGVIIITGAAENGLSTTYYSLLKTINNKSIYSLELYPYQNNNLNNINVINPKKYGGVSACLDKLMKLDSELIGIDANLDQNDLKKIWQASYSGRLIIITLEAINTAQVLKILKRSGLSTAAIASQLTLIIGQKLFARPCSKCLYKFEPPVNIKKTIIKKWPIATYFWPQKLYQNYGCSACQSQSKLTATFEIMRFLPDGCLTNDYQPLIIDALNKAKLGLINIEDIFTWANSKKKL